MNLTKEKKAIERLKMFEPDDGYYLAYSGGKDSDCIKILAQLVDVKFEAVHNLTTVDAPETMAYIKSQPDIQIDKARDKDGHHITMWNLIVQKGMPPTRLARYCCSVFKEGGGKGKVVVTGVRWSESNRRAESAGVVKILGKPKTNQKAAQEYGANFRVSKAGGLLMNDDNDPARRMVEHCYRTSKTMVNPIVDWTNADAWEYLHHYGCRGNPLYQCGMRRIGCLGCTLGGPASMRREFAMYPKYRQNYVATFDRMIQKRIADGKPVNDAWKDGESVMRWWLGENPAQICIYELEEILC